MLKSKLFPASSTLIAALFVIVILLIYPLWTSIYAFLGLRLPVMPVLMLLGILYGAYGIHRLAVSGSSGEHKLAHLITMGLVDLVLIALLGALFYNLGTERATVLRSAAAYLPFTAGFGLVLLLVWFGPAWKPLQTRRMRATLIAGLALILFVSMSLPWQIRMETQPVAIMAQDGVTLAWETNMLSSSWLEYGVQPGMGMRASSQADGLLALNDRIQRVFIPVSPGVSDLYLKAHSMGVASFDLANILKAGQAQSGTVHLPLPAQNAAISLVAFSDLHERRDLYQKLAAHLPWAEENFAVYIGDLVNSTVEPGQMAQSFLDLPTGGLSLPRIYVRGNHEARGIAARQLGDWLLPPGGKWYFSFSAGNVFFVVLDSGEDKADNHPEYAGLVDFASYHREQASWLARVFASPQYQNAAYRVVLVHVPPFIDLHPELGSVSPDFAPVLGLLKSQPDISLMMSGHIHQAAIWLPEQTGLPYPITTCGGAEVNDMAAVTASFGEQGISLQVVDLQGQVLQKEFIPKK